MRIVLTGGGTGGHLTPLVAIADVLRDGSRQHTIRIPKSRNGGKIELRYVGPVSDMDKRVLEEADIPFEHIPSGKIRRYASGAGLTMVDMLFRLPWGILRALWRMYVLMPEAVFSKGGYGSVPVVIASFIYRIPVLMHETDTVPGLANRKLAKFVTAIAVGFRIAEDHFPQKKTFVSGVPIRSMFRSQPSKEQGRAVLKLHDRKPVLFIIGGSQGSQRINSPVLELLVALLPEFQVVHQVGSINEGPVQKLLDSTFADFPDITDYHMSGYMSDKEILHAYAAADLVISRAGGTTLAEIAAMGCPSILVPLRESAGNHQWRNAYLFREAGASLVLDETNLAPALLESTIRRLFDNPKQLEEMAEYAKRMARYSADEDIANLLISMGSGYAPRKTDLEHATASGG